MIELRMLGQLDLRGADGQELRDVLVQPKRLALLVYLAAARGAFRRRDTLLGLFWPDLDQAHARDALKQAVSHLRRGLVSDEVVIVNRGTEELSVSSDALRSDVAAFTDALDAGQTEQALELYRGDLLEGFFGSGMPEFDDWLSRERNRLRALACQAAQQLARRAEEQGAITSALRFAERAAELSELDERVLRQLVHLLDLAGDRAGALRTHDAFARRLAAEYGAEPSAETRDLVRRIRARETPSEVEPSGSANGSKPALDFVPDVPAAETLPPTRRKSNRTFLAAAGIVAVVGAIALGAWIVRAQIGNARRVGIMLADRRQLTFTGHVAIPSISGDGKTLAYRTTNCRPAGCTYGIELHDVIGATSRQLFDGASAIYEIEWSPDRRNLLFAGSIDSRYGSYLVSALGGTPKRVAYGATFYAGGDSLLSVMKARIDLGSTQQWARVSGLDGVAHDSIPVAGPAEAATFFEALPGTKWIVVGVFRYPSVPDGRPLGLESRVIGRDGRVVSRTFIGRAGTDPEGHASSGALWVSPGGPTSPKRTLLRIRLDAASGRLSSSIDTLDTGVHTRFGITADGRGLVLDEGSTEFGLWGLDVSEAVRGVFPERKRMLRSTSPLNVRLSRDGKRVLVGHDIGPAVNALQRWTTVPFGGSVETPLALSGQAAQAIWSDSTTVAIWDRTPTGSRLALVDVETGAVRQHFDLSERTPPTYSQLPAGGWVWVRGFPRGLDVGFPGDPSPRRIRLPAWYMGVNAVDVSHDGRFVGFVGWKSPNQDSVGVGVLALEDSTATHWFTTSGERGEVTRLKDGTFLLRLADTPETYSLYHLLAPRRAEKLGAIPRMVSSLSVSEDLKRAAVVVRDYHGDAWMSRVARP